MRNVLMVGVGGFLGSVARYMLGGYITQRLVTWTFPISTFAINILGCFVIGALAGLMEKHAFLSAGSRLFLFTGVLGGFTTFSAFGLEGVSLFRRGESMVALSYAALSVVVGFAAVWIGWKLFSLGAPE